MPSWAVKQRREHEHQGVEGVEGRERTQALKAATTAGPLPGLTTKASKKSEREEEEENDAISTAVADSEERRERRLRHKEQRARVRANMMATAMTQTGMAGSRSPISSPRIMSGHVTMKQAGQTVKTMGRLLPLPSLQATKTTTALLKTARTGKTPRSKSPGSKTPRVTSPRVTPRRSKTPRKDTHELGPGSPEDTPREDMSETSRGALRSTTRAGDADMLDDTDLEWGTLLSQRGNTEGLNSGPGRVTGLGGDTDLMSHTSTAVIRAGRVEATHTRHCSDDACTGTGCEGVVRITIAGLFGA